MSSKNAYNPEAPSILPRVQPKWKRAVTSDNVQPFPIQESNGNACGVCRQHESRYKCPRCAIPYCSVTCYKKHDAYGATCTESFYQERVSTVLRLEQKEESGSMKKILNRYHRVLSEEEGGGEQEKDQEEISEDLWRLAEALEQGTIVDEDTDKLLSPEMRLAFERAVRSGELSNSIEPWHPWWTPEYISEASSGQRVGNKGRLTLDERLLNVPPFSSLRPGRLPLLAYNAVDLLYSVALTLRLYNGVDNAVAVCQEAAHTLVGASAVLREDSRHTTVTEALMKCTADSTHAEGGENTHWTVLARDVVYLCSSRHMSHALLEAIDIVNAAAKALKAQGQVENASRMRRIGKKLEFYLSWSQEATLPGDLEDEIKTWIDEWKGVNEAESDSLWLPAPDNQRRERSISKEGVASESLLTEVCSRGLRRKQNGLTAKSAKYEYTESQHYYA